MDITLDFETYYDDKYSLRRLQTLDYVTDERFEISMCGIKEGDKKTVIYAGTSLAFKLRELFGPGNRNTLICQNTPFDGLILDKIYNLRPYRYADTMAMFKGLAPYLQANLETICESLFPDDPTIRKTKELADFKGRHYADLSPEEQAIFDKYCINDVDVTYAAYQRMLQFYPKDELDIIDITIKMWCQPKFLLDSPRVEQYLVDIEAEKERLLAEAKNKFGISKTTLSSNQQFAAWIADQGFEIPIKVNEKGKETFAFAKDDLAFTELRESQPDYKPVWDARISVKSTIEKSRSERLLNNASKDNGYLRVPLRYYGAHTGRYSGMEKINMQNFKRGSELRRSLIAPEDKLVYVADSSQIEARMNAWLSGQADLCAKFAKDADIYSEFASLIYGRPVNRKRKEIDENGNEYTPDYLEGFVGKVAILGLGYQMSWGKFQTTLKKGAMGGPPIHFTDAEAKRIVDLYRSQNHMIKSNWTRAQNMLYHMLDPECDIMWGPMRVLHKRIQLPNGMFINYPQLTCFENQDGRVQFEYHNGKHLTNVYGGKLVENVVQALARIVVMEQLLEVTRTMPEMELALQVHDEGVFIGPDTTKQENDDRMNAIIQIMSTAPSWAPDLPISAEGGYAKDYSK